MSWHDRMQKAKFRGLDFYVDGTQLTKGRRVPIRRLAGQDGSVQQDLGQNEDTIDISAFFWGPEYDKARDDFEAALTTEGAAALVLPTRGELNVRVFGDVRTQERKNELGYCTIEFSVVIEKRAGAGAGASAASAGVKAKADSAAGLAKSAAKAKDTATSNAEKAINVAGMPAKAVKSTTAAVSAATSALKSVQRQVQAALNPLEDLSAQINELDAVVGTLLSTPSAFVTKVTAVVLATVGLADTAQRSVDRTTGLIENAGTPFEKAASARATAAALKEIRAIGAAATTNDGISVGAGSAGIGGVDTNGVGGGVTSGGTGFSGSTSGSSAGGGGSGSGSSVVGGSAGSSGGGGARTVAQQEIVNTRTVYELIRTVALARAAQTFATANFDSSTQALSVLEATSAEIDALQEYTLSDEVFFALGELRAALTTHLTKVASELPGAVAYVPAGLILASVRGAGGTDTANAPGIASSEAQVTQRTTQRRAGLPRVLSYDPPREVPAILIAHELYGDAALEADIVARNAVPHPLFISGPIEVIEP